MPKPTLHSCTLIFLKHRVHRRSVNKPIIELRASDVIESTHVAGVGRFIIYIEMLVNEAKLFEEIQHDGRWSANDSAVQQGVSRERLLVFRKASNLIS